MTAYDMRISDWSSDVCSSDLGAAVVDRSKPAQPRLAEQGHVDAERQRAQTGVGADIARRLFAADMLLAGRQGQHENAFDIGIDRLAAQAAGNMPDIFRLAGEQADIGSAEQIGRPSCRERTCK